MKKKILLIRPAAPDKSAFSTTEKRAPIGIASLISVLRHRGHEVKFVDMYIGECCNGVEIDKFSPDYVGMYLDTITFDEALFSLKELNSIREYLAKSKKWFKIMVGGPHSTLRTQDIPKFVDYIVQGEGEEAIVRIVEDGEDNRIIKDPYIEDLDEIPMPDYDELYEHNYDWTAPEIHSKKVAIMSTSRGCPYKCKFCSAFELWGCKYRFMSADKIIEHVKYLKDNHNIDGIYFREDNFIANVKRTKEFCEKIIRYKIPWKCEARVNNLTDEMITLLANSGCAALYIGVESGSQKILDLMNKGIKVEDTKRVFKRLKEVGIKGYASIIVGFPGETTDDMNKTTELIREIEPHTTWWNVFTGLPGSEAYDMMDCWYEGEWGMRYPIYWNMYANRFYGEGIPWRVPIDKYKLVNGGKRK